VVEVEAKRGGPTISEMTGSIDWLNPRHLEHYKHSPVSGGYPAAHLVAGMAHARLSYKTEPEIQKELAPSGWVADLHSPGAGAQAYLALHASTRTAAMAFRGSQGREFWRDWIRTDMRAGVLRKWKDKDSDLAGPRRQRGASGSVITDCLPKGVRCGWGFQGPVNKLWPVIMQAAELQARGWKLFLFGHSMGADLAHMAAARLIYTESVYPDLVIGYEPAKLWNRAGQAWQWQLTQGVAHGLSSYTFMNTSRGYQDLITDMPPWAKHGGVLLVAGEDTVYTGKNAVAKYNLNKPPYRHNLPGWRPVSRLLTRLWKRGRGRVGAHLGRGVMAKLERLYLEGSLV